MTTYRKGAGAGLVALFRGRRFNRGAAWGMMIIGALLAFEIFNFSTTQFALRDVLGDLTFAGFRWATILAVAFCGIDFAGIARIFTPEQGADEPKEVYYLFGAWFLAAAFNAILTWWGVSVAIVSHASASGGAVVSTATMTKVVPIFVAAMILLVRVMIIGTFSLAGDRLFTTAERRSYSYNNSSACAGTNVSPGPIATDHPPGLHFEPSGTKRARQHQHIPPGAKNEQSAADILHPTGAYLSQHPWSEQSGTHERPILRRVNS